MESLRCLDVVLAQTQRMVVVGTHLGISNAALESSQIHQRKEKTPDLQSRFFVRYDDAIGIVQAVLQVDQEGIAGRLLCWIIVAFR